MLAQDRGRALYWSREDTLREETCDEDTTLKTVITHNREETLALGELIGRSAPGAAVIACRGGLGAGKTTLAKGIAKGLGIDEEVTSPTFTIISEYAGRLTFYHIDAYRLSGESDFAEIGGKEMLEAPSSLCLIEWSERLPEIVNDRTAIIEIRVEEGDQRSLEFRGDWLEALLP